MDWVEYILFYYLTSTILAAFFLITRHGKKNPKINVPIYYMTALLLGWVIMPLIIIDTIFMAVIFVINWIAVKILDWFNI